MQCTKQCCKCQEMKSIDQFLSQPRKTKIYYADMCKACVRERQIDKFKHQPLPSVKTCSKCHKSLTADNFKKDINTKDGLFGWCRLCARDFQQKRYKFFENSTKKEINGKICSTCKQYKSSDNFCKCKQYKDGLNKICKECIKIYTQSHRSQIRRKQTERYKNDPVFRLIQNIRRRILLVIKRGSKSGRTIKLLGCTAIECMEYLEKLFWPGMTRENHGRKGWVTDHIIPIEAFDKNDPLWQFKAFHYTNLQPLWWEDNNVKLARLDWSPAESKYELPERLKVQLASGSSQLLPQSDIQKEQSKL